MTTHLLETNTVSYLLRNHSPTLSSRLMGMAPEALPISVITVGELRFGVKRLGPGQRAAALGQRGRGHVGLHTGGHRDAAAVDVGQHLGEDGGIAVVQPAAAVFHRLVQAQQALV